MLDILIQEDHDQNNFYQIQPQIKKEKKNRTGGFTVIAMHFFHSAHRYLKETISVANN